MPLVRTVDIDVQKHRQLLTAVFAAVARRLKERVVPSEMAHALFRKLKVAGCRSPACCVSIKVAYAQVASR